MEVVAASYIWCHECFIFHGGPDRRIRRLVKQDAQCNDLGRHCLFLEEHTLSNTVDTCRIADGIQNSS